MMAQAEDTASAVQEVNRFCDHTLLSKRSVSKLLGVSTSTLIRWLRGDTEPYDWMAQQALRRIAIFDAEDRANGLYERIISMSARERTAELERVLEEHKEPTA